MASAPPFQRQTEPLIALSPFADPDEVDPALEDFLHRASSLLCGWLGRSSNGTPLPGLSAMPAIEPEGVGLSPDRLLADLQMVMEGAYNPSHPGAHHRMRVQGGVLAVEGQQLLENWFRQRRRQER